MLPNPTVYMCLDLSSPHDACQKRKLKRNRENNFDSLHKNKYWKVKDRPFAKESRGCHALICLYAQSLGARECHVVLPLKMTTFIMQSVAFILFHPSSYNAQFSLTLNDLTFRSNFYCLIAPMKTYLKNIIQSLVRYGGLLKIRFGF